MAYASSNVAFAFIGRHPERSPANMGWSLRATYIFGPADQGKPVVITYTTQAAGSYTPNLTPVYDLTDSDFVDEKGNKDPVQVERVDIFSLPTIQRIEVCRATTNIATPVEARDQSQIELFGPRVGSTIQAHEICDEFIMGPLIAQTILQRELYVRTKFTFKLSWEYCLLDPMDIVTITDANLGFDNYSGARHRDRGGRQGAARVHLRGVRLRRLDAGVLPERGRGAFSRTGACPRSRSTRRSSSSRRPL